jgi:hypothetical protein
MFAYSSGKLADWYSDLLDEKAVRLVLGKLKVGWQRGWFAQHQRLIEALVAQKKRAPLILQGEVRLPVGVRFEGPRRGNETESALTERHC